MYITSQTFLSPIKKKDVSTPIRDDYFSYYLMIIGTSKSF